MLALMQRREKNGLSTKIVFPRERPAISFIRRWQFVQALESLLNIDVAKLCDDADDISFLKDDGVQYQYAPTAINVGGEDLTLKSNSFVETMFYNFGSKTLADSSVSSGPIIRTQHDLYNSAYVQSVLLRKFRGARRAPITKTLGELINNAFEHPNANTLLVMSHCPKQSKYNLREYVEICVFDNGLGIHQTLLDSLRSGHDIFHNSSSSIDVHVTLNNKTADGSIRQRIALKVRDLLNINSSRSLPPADLLISSIFPGVSSRRGGGRGETFDSMPEFEGKLSGDGNGLFIAAYIACHSGQGTLTIRTGPFVMKIAANLAETDVNNSIFGFEIELRTNEHSDQIVDGNIVTAKVHLS